MFVKAVRIQQRCGVNKDHVPLYNGVSMSSGFTERHADRRLLPVALCDLPEADGTDGGGAAVSRRCRRPHRLLSAQAFSKSPGTGQRKLHEVHFGQFFKQPKAFIWFCL